MNQELHDAFGSVRAGQQLKDDTLRRVRAGMNKRSHSLPRTAVRLSLAACCLFLVCAGSLGGLYFTEAAAISIDVNPSIELSLNRWGRVVGEQAFGPDGRRVLEGLSLRHKSFQQAVELILDSESAQQYLGGNSLVSVTVEASGQPEQLMNDVRACVDQTLAGHHAGTQAEFSCVDSELREEAHSHGMSAGKYLAIQEILENDPNATLDEFRGCSMQEIRGHAEECHHNSQPSAETAAGQQAAPQATAPAGMGRGRGHHSSRHHAE